MNILITGGAGFIGSHTADALIKMGYQVRILDNLQRTVHPEGKPDYLNPNADFIMGDVRDKQVLSQALSGVDAVYHLAAHQDYLPDFSTFFYVNSVSTALLYEILVVEGLENSIQQVVVASSQAVMGEGRYRCIKCHGQDGEYVHPDIRLEAQLKTENGSIVARFAARRCSGSHRTKPWRIRAINMLYLNIPRNRLPYRWGNGIKFPLWSCGTPLFRDLANRCITLILGP